MCKKCICVKMGLLGNIDLQSIQNTDLQSLQDNFPKGRIFNPKALFLSKIHSEYNFPSKPHFPFKCIFTYTQKSLKNINSHQEQKIGMNMFSLPNMSLFIKVNTFLLKCPSNPLRMSIFPLNPIFNPDTYFFIPKSLLRMSIFQKCTTFHPTTLFGPNILFSTPNFPKASF